MTCQYLVDFFNLDLFLVQCAQSCLLLALVHARPSSLLQHAQNLRWFHVEHLTQHKSVDNWQMQMQCMWEQRDGTA